MTSIHLDKRKYLGIQIFIKTRLRLIQKFLNKKWTTGTIGTDIEFLAIQFRKIIEEVALSSLVLHKDKYIEFRNSFDKDWNARLILQDIKRLNPEYFPKPAKISEVTPGSNRFTFEIFESGDLDFMTEKAFVNIYEKCGKYLHAFNPYSKSILDPDQIKASMKLWETRLSNLLEENIIEFFMNDNVAFTKMNLTSDSIPDLIIFKPE